MAGLYRQGHVPNNMDCPATGRPMAVPGPLQRGPTRIPRVSERPRETANSDPGIPGRRLLPSASLHFLKVLKGTAHDFS